MSESLITGVCIGSLRSACRDAAEQAHVGASTIAREVSELPAILGASATGVNDLVDSEPDVQRDVRAVGEVLRRCGLSVAAVSEPELRLGLDASPTVLVGVERDSFYVVSIVSRRRRRLLRVARDGTPAVSRHVSHRKFVDLVAGADIEWLAVHCEAGLSAIAEPGGSIPPWKRLVGLARLESADIRIVVLYAATIGVLTLLVPIATQALVNTIAFGNLLQPLIVLSGALLVGLALAGSMAVLQAYVVEVLQRRLLVRVAEDFGHRLPRVSVRARDHKDLVELNNRFLDVITVQKSAAELLLSGLSLALQILVGLLLLSFYHPYLLVFNVVIIAGLLVVAYLGRGGTETARTESRSKFALAGWLDELARAPQRFAAGHGRELAIEELERRTHDYVRARSNHFQRVLAVIIGGVSLQIVAIVAVLTIGAWLVIERELTLGQLVASEIIVGAIAVGIAKFGKFADKAFDLVAATDKIGKILDLPLRPERHDSLPSTTAPMTVAASRLEVGYAGTAAVAEVNMVLEPGMKVVLDGPPGVGKTALLQTLAGWRPAIGGTLLWDGCSGPRTDDLMRQALFIGTSEIHAGSVFANLREGDAFVSSQVAWQALDIVGLGDRIRAMPAAIDTMLRPGGAPLSPSETARLLLARVVIAKPRLLLVDHTLDFIAASDELLERIVGPDARWTAVVATKDPRVRAVVPRTVEVVAKPSRAGGKLGAQARDTEGK